MSLEISGVQVCVYIHQYIHIQNTLSKRSYESQDDLKMCTPKASISILACCRCALLRYKCSLYVRSKHETHRVEDKLYIKEATDCKLSYQKVLEQKSSSLCGIWYDVTSY